MEKEKYGFIYIWRDSKRKMYYIGCHWGTILDGYICSSNRMRDAYRRRPEDFKRRIIKANISRDQLLEEEYKWLLLIPENELGNKYYNLRAHKWGHWTTDTVKSLTIKEKISNAQKGQTRKPHSEETREKIRKANTGKKRTQESIEKQRQQLIGRKQDPELIAKRVNSIKGKKQKLRTCPHCGTVGAGPRMTTHHFDNCTGSKKYQPKETVVVWSKGLTAKTDERLRKIGEKNSLRMIGGTSWNKGLTKETDIRIRTISDKNAGKTAWNKGKTKKDLPQISAYHISSVKYTITFPNGQTETRLGVIDLPNMSRWQLYHMLSPKMMNIEQEKNGYRVKRIT